MTLVATFQTVQVVHTSSTVLRETCKSGKCILIWLCELMCMKGSLHCSYYEPEVDVLYKCRACTYTVRQLAAGKKYIIQTLTLQPTNILSRLQMELRSSKGTTALILSEPRWLPNIFHGSLLPNSMWKFIQSTWYCQSICDNVMRFPLQRNLVRWTILNTNAFKIIKWNFVYLH